MSATAEAPKESKDVKGAEQKEEAKPVEAVKPTLTAADLEKQLLTRIKAEVCAVSVVSQQTCRRIENGDELLAYVSGKRHLMIQLHLPVEDQDGLDNAVEVFRLVATGRGVKIK